MKRIFILGMLVFLLGINPVYASKSLVYNVFAYNVSEPQRLMDLFLKILRDDNAADIKKFIQDNYSEKFLQIPMKVHLKVIRDLQRDFSRYTVTQTTEEGNKISIVIKSPVNKMKKITIEANGNKPVKIFIIDVKDPE
jgi:hypothetical protein